MAEKTNSRLTELILKLYSCDAVKFGSFTLKSGIQSPVYFDLRIIISYPELMRQVAELLWGVSVSADLKFDCICGVPYTALPLATVMSVDHNVPMLIRRKEAKDYGTKKIIEGNFKAGDTCLIIEDVVTSGSSVLETVKTLTAAGLVVTDAIVLLDRSQGGRTNLQSSHINLHSVCSLPEILDVLQREGKIGTDTVASVHRFIEENSQVQSPAVTEPTMNNEKRRKKMLSYHERAELCSHPVSRKLFDIMAKKKTNLAFSVDVTSSAKLLELAASVGPHICILKTHIDILNDFTDKFLDELMKLARLHNFLVFEDRKFADIGHTVLSQYEAGMYHISDWAHIINAHVVPGPGVIAALKKSGLSRDCGCLLVAEMSTQGSLAHGDYTKAAVTMAEANSDFVIGFICQSKLSEDPRFIHMSPGVHLAADSGDDLGQNYNHPDEMIGSRRVDVLIVGRGILNSSDPVQVAQRYQQVGYAAYEKALEE